MNKTHVEGRVIKISQPVERVFSLFSDLNNFSERVPEDMRVGVDLQTTTDTLSAKVKGFVLGVQIAERMPYKTIRLSNYSQLPISFDFFINFDAISEEECFIKLTLDTELSGMIKIMVGSKLQEVVDKMTDAIERSFSNI